MHINRKNVVVWLDVLALVAVLAIGGWALNNWMRDPIPAPQVEAGSFDLVVDSRGFHMEVRGAARGTVFEVAKQALESRNIEFAYKEYPGMGTLVTKIGQEENGQGGAYWQFWVNGQYSEKAADQTLIAANDRVDWKFSTSTSE